MNKTEENLRRIREYNRRHVGDSAFAVQDDWDESKHPRAANGQFGSGGGGSAPAASKKDTSYTYGKTTQSPTDKAIRNNPDYIGNDAMKKLLGGEKVTGFRFVKAPSTHGYINTPGEVTVEYSYLWYDDGEKRKFTSTTTFSADKIFKK